MCGSVAKTSKNKMLGWVVAMGLLLTPLGCDQVESSSPAEPTRETVVPEHKATAVVTPSQPSRAELAAFAQVLARKLDPKQETHVASPGGGTLNIPNDYVAHASVLVRGPNGELRSACVSSPAEVSALVEQAQEGAQP